MTPSTLTELLKRGQPGSVPKRKHPIRPRGPRIQKFGATLQELLAMDPLAQGTTLERMVDGAAKRLGFKFDGFQVKLPLHIAGRRTVIDRVRMLPGGRAMLIFIDGPQHDLRPEQAQVDAMQTMELEAMGYIVIRLKYRELLLDPVGYVRRTVLFRSIYG